MTKKRKQRGRIVFFITVNKVLKDFQCLVNLNILNIRNALKILSSRKDLMIAKFTPSNRSSIKEHTIMTKSKRFEES